MLKSEFPVEAIIIFVKSIKKGIKWYIHFIQKPVILFALVLPSAIQFYPNLFSWTNCPLCGVCLFCVCLFCLVWLFILISVCFGLIYLLVLIYNSLCLKNYLT